MGQFRVSISEGAQASLDAFCEASGAARSDVIETLIVDYLEELCKRVGALAQPDDEDEGVDTDEDEEEADEADEDEEEEEEK